MVRTNGVPMSELSEECKASLKEQKLANKRMITIKIVRENDRFGGKKTVDHVFYFDPDHDKINISFEKGC